MCDYLGGNLDFYTHLFSDGRQLFEKKRLLQRLRVGAVSSFVMLTREKGKRLCRGEIFQETCCRHVSIVFLKDIYSIASNVIQVCIILKIFYQYFIIKMFKCTYSKIKTNTPLYVLFRNLSFALAVHEYILLLVYL